MSHEHARLGRQAPHTHTWRQNMEHVKKKYCTHTHIVHVPTVVPAQVGKPAHGGALWSNIVLLFEQVRMPDRSGKTFTCAVLTVHQARHMFH